MLSGSALKVLVAVAMLIDHTAGALLLKNPGGLFSIAGRTVTLYIYDIEDEAWLGGFMKAVY